MDFNSIHGFGFRLLYYNNESSSYTGLIIVFNTNWITEVHLRLDLIWQLYNTTAKECMLYLRFKFKTNTYKSEGNMCITGMSIFFWQFHGMTLIGYI